jgi:tRNA(Ile)-lysidine synthase
MARLGPFGARPRLAAGVSGGADSSALALLAAEWGTAQGGTFRALIVDHGLRAESAAEAALTASRLTARGIDAQIITLAVPAGPALQARARAARLAALTQAANAGGFLHLLLGHQAADQAETLAMRAARGPGGAEGIAAWTARANILVLRPLLRMPPADLRAYLTAQGMGWVEDPSNRNPHFERVRVRALSPSGAGDPAARQARDQDTASFLARFATISPLGFATLHADTAPPAAVAALLRIIAGADYPPRADATTRLAAKLRPATLHGVRISPAPEGWRFTREAAACAADESCDENGGGALAWDGRFTLIPPALPGDRLGALGLEAANTAGLRHLPATVRRTLPAWRRAGGETVAPAPARFTPPAPACAHPFST